MGKVTNKEVPQKNGKPKKVLEDEFVVYTGVNYTRKPMITVSKKVASLAVNRNRIRRTIKEALRSMKKENSQIHIIVKMNISNLKTGEVREKLEKVFK